MKTSVIEVHDMLAVLSVDGEEKRIGEVTGVESVTVNYADKNATVRYDETRLNIADIKSAVRQRGYESATPAASAGDGHEGHTVPAGQPASLAPRCCENSPSRTCRRCRARSSRSRWSRGPRRTGRAASNAHSRRAESRHSRACRRTSARARCAEIRAEHCRRRVSGARGQGPRGPHSAGRAARHVGRYGA